MNVVNQCGSVYVPVSFAPNIRCQVNAAKHFPHAHTLLCKHTGIIILNVYETGRTATEIQWERKKNSQELSQARTMCSFFVFFFYVICVFFCTFIFSQQKFRSFRHLFFLRANSPSTIRIFWFICIVRCWSQYFLSFLFLYCVFLLYYHPSWDIITTISTFRAGYWFFVCVHVVRHFYIFFSLSSRYFWYIFFSFRFDDSLFSTIVCFHWFPCNSTFHYTDPSCKEKYWDWDYTKRQ